ncbi:MAG: hypothetical protein AAGA20_21695, partial [Planctomycetota bacterium]
MNYGLGPNRPPTMSTPSTEIIRAGRSAIAAFAAASLAGVTFAHPNAPQEVELEVRWIAPDRLFVGQTFDLAVEIEIPAPPDELGFVQLFARPLDLPVQLDAFAGVDGLVFAPGADGEGPTLVVDGEVVAGDAVGAQLAWRIVRRARASRAGAIALPAPSVRFATATRFEEDLVRGRVPLDRTESVARGEATELAVNALPEVGRPIEFEGAIGAFELLASVDRNAVDV